MKLAVELAEIVAAFFTYVFLLYSSKVVTDVPTAGPFKSKEPLILTDPVIWWVSLIPSPNFVEPLSYKIVEDTSSEVYDCAVKSPSITALPPIVKAPVATNEPVICKLFVVVYAEPVAVNIPPAPAEEIVWTNRSEPTHSTPLLEIVTPSPAWSIRGYSVVVLLGDVSPDIVTCWTPSSCLTIEATLTSVSAPIVSIFGVRSYCIIWGPANSLNASGIK